MSLDDHLQDPGARRAVVVELRAQAESTIRELVCCDEYDQAARNGFRGVKIKHEICYWGAAHASGLRFRADEIERMT